LHPEICLLEWSCGRRCNVKRQVPDSLLLQLLPTKKSAPIQQFPKLTAIKRCRLLLSMYKHEPTGRPHAINIFIYFYGSCSRRQQNHQPPQQRCFGALKAGWCSHSLALNLPLKLFFAAPNFCVVYSRPL
jgi:hypothetical protein